MRPRRDAVALGLVVVQTLLFWGTFHLPGLGVPVWHHFASLGLVAVGALALHRPLVASRRFLAIGVLTASLLATLSGFWLLYWKEGIRIGGYQDWGVFWHVLWSWAAAVFFLMHTWINRASFVHFFRKSLQTARPAATHLGLYALLLVGFAVTWSTEGRQWFTNENYLALGFYAWLVATVPPYLLWGYIRLRTASPPRAEWTDRLGHWRVRGAVDLALVPIAALVVLSGIVLTFFDPAMDQWVLKYVSKYWHVWPSVLFSVLAFAHSVQAWTTVRAHWRRFAASAP